MSTFRTRWTVVAAVAIGVAAVLVLGACASDDPGAPASGTDASGHGGMGGMVDGSAFGMPGDPDEVDRTIVVSALDELAYEPETIEVKVDETVEFVVTNEGEIAHEFVLGDASFQAMHGDEMAGMGTEMPADGPMSVGLAPGETTSLVWTFTEAMTLEYACHVPGHYEGGMVGTIDVVDS